MQAFSAQAAVSEDQIVLAHGLTNDRTDANHLAPMLERMPDTPKLISNWDMNEKLKTSRGKEIYALRKVLVEPIFGQIKAAIGFRRAGDLWMLRR